MDADLIACQRSEAVGRKSRRAKTRTHVRYPKPFPSASLSANTSLLHLSTFVVNGGVQVMSERVRLILRSPQDRLQQVVSSSWSWSGDFPIPTDALANGDPSAYKRAVVIEHVGSA